MKITQKQIDNAINNCHYASENRPGNLVPGICSLQCLPCQVVIQNGSCDVLIDLFQKGNK